ncbi:MAG: potassium transporter KefB [Robiginitalea sp.]|nr:potassium transporter KefB [Robiginitalea sp.]
MKNPVFIISQLIKAPHLGNRMLLGAGVGFLFISLFLIMADGAKPEWGDFWMLRPLLIVPLATALGAAFYTFMDPWRQRGGYQQVLANLLSLMGFLFSLWIGSVLGLDGTYWD